MFFLRKTKVFEFLFPFFAHSGSLIFIFCLLYAVYFIESLCCYYMFVNQVRVKLYDYIIKKVSLNVVKCMK